MRTWQHRAAAITVAMLGMEPDAAAGLAGGWPQAWHAAARAGLDAAVVDRIARVTGWTPAQVCDVAALPEWRSKGRGRLDALESDRIVRVAWISAIALVAVDGAHGGQRWFAEWTHITFDQLDGHTPVELMQTTLGAMWLRDALKPWLRGAPE